MPDQQLVLNEQSKQQFTTINTHRGLYQYTRLPFGISCAPAVFQRTMDNLLKVIKHVSVYIDDIVVTGITEEEHLKNLDEVLSRLDGVGARLRKEKKVFSPQIEYLGHLINEKDYILLRARSRPSSFLVNFYQISPQPYIPYIHFYRNQLSGNGDLKRRKHFKKLRHYSVLLDS